MVRGESLSTAPLCICIYQPWLSFILYASNKSRVTTVSVRKCNNSTVNVTVVASLQTVRIVVVMLMLLWGCLGSLLQASSTTVWQWNHIPLVSFMLISGSISFNASPYSASLSYNVVLAAILVVIHV